MTLCSFCEQAIVVISDFLIDEKLVNTGSRLTERIATRNNRICGQEKSPWTSARNPVSPLVSKLFLNVDWEDCCPWVC